jgi:hypothetical protein
VFTQYVVLCRKKGLYKWEISELVRKQRPFGEKDPNTTNFRSLRQKTQSWFFSKRLKGFLTFAKTHSSSSLEQKQMKTRHLHKHLHVFVANSLSIDKLCVFLNIKNPFEPFQKDSKSLKWSGICSKQPFDQKVTIVGFQIRIFLSRSNFDDSLPLFHQKLMIFLTSCSIFWCLCQFGTVLAHILGPMWTCTGTDFSERTHNAEEAHHRSIFHSPSLFSAHIHENTLTVAISAKFSPTPYQIPIPHPSPNLCACYQQDWSFSPPLTAQIYSVSLICGRTHLSLTK